jgi:hypothetical protein
LRRREEEKIVDNQGRNSYPEIEGNELDNALIKRSQRDG